MNLETPEQALKRLLEEAGAVLVEMPYMPAKDRE